jgi:hypothetical protein
MIRDLAVMVSGTKVDDGLEQGEYAEAGETRGCWDIKSKWGVMAVI